MSATVTIRRLAAGPLRSYLGEAISVAADDGQVAFLRRTVAFGSILLHMNNQWLAILRHGFGSRILADMLAWNYVFLDVKDGRGHGHWLALSNSVRRQLSPAAA